MLSPEILDAAQTAALLHAEAETILQLARNGTLPGTRIGKAWIFLREDVMAFLKEQMYEEASRRIPARHWHADIVRNAKLEGAVIKSLDGRHDHSMLSTGF
ncbi:helix-turn-helix domain-containing protein [Noviherbaspirillum sedimenti]|uniref:DNA-binding protein n=1 Tax=Noviherbaspirillum sedimenti TaxID=2320865 RepID=A0A3A3G3I7_9BURK|nr:helix-turn-helix domain-containing protein [Noviherbaspirillum sedimenti]RJG01379.1 DNA-binding protein [Noviherbaspirillum sedimenti]